MVSIDKLTKETLEAVRSESLTTLQRFYHESGGDPENKEARPEHKDAELQRFWKVASDSGVANDLDYFADFQMRKLWDHKKDAQDFFKIICAEMFLLGWNARGATEEAEALKRMAETESG